MTCGSFGSSSGSRSPPGSLGAFGYWQWRYSAEASSGSYRFLAVPFWFLCLVLLMPPAAWFGRFGSARRRKHRGGRRLRLGHCPHCGYDLRGNVSGMCPECGAPAPEARLDEDRASRRVLNP